ncbi:MAG: N-6 DNA methylase [Lachnospiraceae bacterium]|nr:N-6 DNA methylase [Lachnospiraceae bacterium]
MKTEEYLKHFCKLMDKFSYKYSKWDIWNDFLYMSAISLANSVPVYEREEREKQYLKIINKYNKEEQSTFIEMFRVVIEALEYKSGQDFLGSLYHRLNLQQHQKGQFFTPYHIAEFMSQVNFAGDDLEDDLAEKGYISVSDPACGAGVMLIAFANTCIEHKLNYQQKVLFVAQDIDKTAVLMCYIQLALLGCNAIVICGDSLAKPGLHPDNDVWITPFYYLNQWRFNDFFGTESETKSEEEEPCSLINEVDIKMDYKEGKNGQLIFNL